jgi:hypothetical protein
MSANHNPLTLMNYDHSASINLLTPKCTGSLIFLRLSVH